MKNFKVNKLKVTSIHLLLPSLIQSCWHKNKKSGGHNLTMLLSCISHNHNFAAMIEAKTLHTKYALVPQAEFRKIGKNKVKPFTEMLLPSMILIFLITHIRSHETHIKVTNKQWLWQSLQYSNAVTFLLFYSDKANINVVPRQWLRDR